MKLNQLENDIRIMEDSINRMQALARDVETMDDQMDGVRQDLVRDLRHTATRR